MAPFALNGKTSLKPTTLELAARAIIGHLIFTTNRVFAVYRIPPVVISLMHKGYVDDQIESMAKAMGRLEGYKLHLRSVYRQFDVETWRRREHQSQGWPRRTGYNYGSWVDEAAKHMATLDYSNLEVYLTIELGERHHENPVQQVWQKYKEGTGLNRFQVTKSEQMGWLHKSEVITRSLKSSQVLGPVRQARAREIAWLIQRSCDPSLLQPLPTDENVIWGDQIEQLVQYVVTKDPDHKALVSHTKAGPIYQTTLAIGDVAEDSDLPDGWFNLGRFPNVDISQHFELWPHQQAEKLLGKSLQAAQDNAANAEETGGEIPDDDMRKYSYVKELTAELSFSRKGLNKPAPRWHVWARSLDKLLHTVEALTTDLNEWYGISVVQHDRQLDLLMESLPGEKQRVAFGTRYQDASTIGNCLFNTTERIGNLEGPYLGSTGFRYQAVQADDSENIEVRGLVEETRKQGLSPVFYDILGMTDGAIQAPMMTVTGTSGGGKTNLAYKLEEIGILGSGTVLAFTHKRESDGLSKLKVGQQGLINRISFTDPTRPVFLDPFKLGLGREDAMNLADEICTMWLAPRVTHHPNVLTIQGGITRACKAEVNKGPKASMYGVVESLLSDSDRDIKETGELLASMSEHGIGKAMFSHSDLPPNIPEGKWTIVEAEHLDLPNIGTPLEKQTKVQIASSCLIYVFAFWAKRMVTSQELKGKPKIIRLDEAWILTESETGKSLIKWLAKEGRKYRALTIIISQEPVDISDPSIENNLVAAAVFRMLDDDQISTALDVQLGLEDTPDLHDIIKSFPPGSGRCILRLPGQPPSIVQIDLVNAKEAFSTGDVADEVAKPALYSGRN